MKLSFLFMLASLTMSACSPLQTHNQTEPNSSLQPTSKECHWVTRQKGGKVKRCQVLSSY